jgi:hypothetical protein
LHELRKILLTFAALVCFIGTANAVTNFQMGVHAQTVIAAVVELVTGQKYGYYASETTVTASFDTAQVKEINQDEFVSDVASGVAFTSTGSGFVTSHSHLNFYLIGWRDMTDWNPSTATNYVSADTYSSASEGDNPQSINICGNDTKANVLFFGEVATADDKIVQYTIDSDPLNPNTWTPHVSEALDVSATGNFTQSVVWTPNKGAFVVLDNTGQVDTYAANSVCDVRNAVRIPELSYDLNSIGATEANSYYRGIEFVSSGTALLFSNKGETIGATNADEIYIGELTNFPFSVDVVNFVSNGGSLVFDHSATIAGIDEMVNVPSQNKLFVQEQETTLNYSAGLLPIQYSNYEYTDTRPDEYSFAWAENESTSTTAQSDILQITGIAADVPIYVSGSGSYRICSEGTCTTGSPAFTTSDGTVSNNDYVQLQATTPASTDDYNFTMVAIGDSMDIWLTNTNVVHEGLVIDIANGSNWVGIREVKVYDKSGTELVQSVSAVDDTHTSYADLVDGEIGIDSSYNPGTPDRAQYLIDDTPLLGTESSSNGIAVFGDDSTDDLQVFIRFASDASIGRVLIAFNVTGSYCDPIDNQTVTFTGKTSDATLTPTAEPADCSDIYQNNDSSVDWYEWEF